MITAVEQTETIKGVFAMMMLMPFLAIIKKKSVLFSKTVFSNQCVVRDGRLCLGKWLFLTDLRTFAITRMPALR